MSGWWRDLAVRFSSCSIRPVTAARSISSYRFAGGVRRFCQLIFLTRFARHQLAAWHIVFLSVSSLVSLVSSCVASCVCSLRLVRLSVSSRRSAGGSSLRLARRLVLVLFVIPRCFVLSGSSRLRLVLSRLAHASCPSSPCFRFAWASRGAGRVLASYSSYSRLIRQLRLMSMGMGGGSSRLCLVAACLFSRCYPSSWGRGDGGMGVLVRRYGVTCRFIQLVFLISAGTRRQG